MSAIFDRISAEGKSVRYVSSKAYNTAKNAFGSVDSKEQANLIEASKTAVKLLFPLEPKLLSGEGTLLLEIASDSIAIGSAGDVRDVICSRDDNWTVGISCKHNHEALRHPRVTEGKDFGSDWIGIPCSREFINEITPITDSLISYGQNRILWRNVPNKWDQYYVPILSAYLKEIQRMCDKNPLVPSKLLSYFFGSNDFYKVIMKGRRRTTTIEAFNMHGTLNAPNGRHRTMTRIPTTKMPTRLIDAAFKGTFSGKSKTTIILTFDNGWAISMRLHNKDDIAKPTSLAWDVNLIGLPPSTYVNTHSWDE